MSRRVLAESDRPTAAYAACCTAATLRRQAAIWFQLAKFRVTNLQTLPRSERAPRE